MRATGAWIRAVDAALGIKRTETTTAKQHIGIALTRPPGHHATYSDPNGFCIYNFAMAAAAHALTSNPGMKTEDINTRLGRPFWSGHNGYT